MKKSYTKLPLMRCVAGKLYRDVSAPHVTETPKHYPLFVAYALRMRKRESASAQMIETVMIGPERAAHCSSEKILIQEVAFPGDGCRSSFS